MDRTESQQWKPAETDGEASASGGGGGEEGGKTPESGGRLYKEITEWIKALAIAALLVFVIRWLLFAPFIVDGPSMQPNFETGERLIVNKIIYDIRAPKRGEVVVFYVPEEDRDFIKRVIGVPGDTVRLEGDDLYINGQQVTEPYIQEAVAAARAQGLLYNQRGAFIGENFPNEYVAEDTVPEGTILAFGDNRGNSKDSRMIGFVPYGDIIGRADLVFWPVNDIGLIKHRAPVPDAE